MLPSTVKILLCTVPQDMRRSFDTLAAVTQQLLGEDPQSGTLYVFMAKRPTRVKILWWDTHGYCLLYKRLHRALFHFPAGPKDVAGLEIDGEALAQLLAGVAHEKKNRRRLN